MSDLMPLWQIESELEALLDCVAICDDGLRPELEARIAQYLGAEVEKIDRVGAVLATLDAVQANAKAEIERLRQRQQSAEKAAERLGTYVLHVLRQREGRPLKGRTCTLSVRRSEALIITDPQLVPEQWKRITVVTDVPKDPIKKAIRAGEVIPGVVLETREHLQRK